MGTPIKISAASRPWLNPVRLARLKMATDSIIGLMIESNIHEGNQSSEQPREAMKYGVSVTDACISWETTEALLRELDKDLRGHLAARLV